MSYQEKVTTTEGTAPYAVSETLQRGAFYWVRVTCGFNEEAMLPKTEWQPARYTGKSADTYAREETRGDQIVCVAYSPDTWDFLGRASADGHHHVDVMQVGDIITPVL